MKKETRKPYEVLCCDEKGNHIVYEYFRTKAQAFKAGKEHKATGKYDSVIVQYVSDTQIEDDWTI